MERLNFSHLYYFYIVAKEGSIKAATEKLFVTQSTISDQIKLLEDFFNTKLFDRKNRSLILNRDGELVLEYAEQVFSLEKELTDRLKHRLDIPKRSLDVGVTHRMNHSFHYETIVGLFGHDDIAVNFVEGERHRLIADLENGELDIVFTMEKETGSKILDSYKYGKNKNLILGHKKFKKKLKNFPEDLHELELFHYPKDSNLRYELDMYFSRVGVVPIIIGEGDDILIHELVASKGLGVVIVPEGSAHRILNNKDLVVLGEIDELDFQVWGIIKNSYKGLGYQLLKGKI